MKSKLLKEFARSKKKAERFDEDLGAVRLSKVNEFNVVRPVRRRPRLEIDAEERSSSSSDSSDSSDSHYSDVVASKTKLKSQFDESHISRQRNVLKNIAALRVEMEDRNFTKWNNKTLESLKTLLNAAQSKARASGTKEYRTTDDVDKTHARVIESTESELYSNAMSSFKMGRSVLNDRRGCSEKDFFAKLRSDFLNEHDDRKKPLKLKSRHKNRVRYTAHPELKSFATPTGPLSKTPMLYATLFESISNE